VKVEHYAELVMRLNKQLAQEMQDTSVTFTLNDLDQRFQALLQRLESDSTCRRGEDYPPVDTKEQWLRAQLVTIQRLARGEKL
jgi:hypothetical protein